MKVREVVSNAAAVAAVGALLWLMYMSVGCAARVKDGSRPATPYEQALAWNAILANANESAAEAVIALNESGDVGDGFTAAVTAENFRIAAWNKELTLILQRGPDYARSQTAVIADLLARIDQAARRLIDSGQLGIKSPERQETVADQLTTVVTLAQQIAVALRQAGVLR